MATLLNVIESEMTREEAIVRVADIWHNAHIEYYDTTKTRVDEYLKSLEALGIVKFKEKPVIKQLCGADHKRHGVISVEEWPEGLVLWVGGKIVYESWKK